ncbi:hypothetical protein [Boudabousia marimammalium]|uniref:Multidrug resistance protein MdtA-like C-terminal permuted SH3 domain-containing protein n=1 Tax=Boudabousia marimammalium TaxID=156892 RepID=A0A1Q5PSU5_9ACTO|nr:hypothetical protein [Boudabousia marimammalium]OKL50618.1 hypothetical protein BM477_01305 [Boudabousia marimammalium]
MATVLMVSVLAVTGCSTDTSAKEPQHSNPAATQQESTVTAELRDIVATYSTNTVVQKDGTYAVLTPARASFKPKVKVGDQVKKGDILGMSGDAQLVAAADSKVVFIQASEPDLPENYPVIALRYSGFSLQLKDESPSGLGSVEQLQGAFQIEKGPGPSDCQAIAIASGTESLVADETAAGASPPDQVLSENSETNAFTPEASVRLTTGGLLCLIDKSVPVQLGQQATIVLHGIKRSQVLALPVTAVAGRQAKGKVTLVQNTKSQPVEVGLGISDGSLIEITSGLKAGDQVNSVAPNLDPRGK